MSKSYGYDADNDDDDEEKNNENTPFQVEESEDVSNYLYKEELLYAFDLKNYDDKIINDKLKVLFKFIKNNLLDVNVNKKFLECLKTLANVLLLEEEEDGFIGLFSYNNFHIAHLCIIDILNTSVVSDENLNALIISINNLIY